MMRLLLPSAGISTAILKMPFSETENLNATDCQDYQIQTALAKKTHAVFGDVTALSSKTGFNSTLGKKKKTLLKNFWWG